jgi:hypothetical protein
MPDLMQTLFTVTLPDGTTEKRGSKRYEYTHVVTVARLDGPGWVVQSWHTSAIQAAEALAWWCDTFGSTRASVILPVAAEKVFRKRGNRSEAAQHKTALTRKIRGLEWSVASLAKRIQRDTSQREQIIQSLMEEAVGRAEAEDMLDRRLSEARDQHANALAELERTRAARSLADDERVRTAAAE